MIVAAGPAIAYPFDGDNNPVPGSRYQRGIAFERSHFGSFGPAATQRRSFSDRRPQAYDRRTTLR